MSYKHLYGCENRTPTADTERKIHAFEMIGYRRLLRISYTEHKTNDYVWQQVSLCLCRRSGTPLALMTYRHKLSWFGKCLQTQLSAQVHPSGNIEGNRRRGRQIMSWEDNVKNWTGHTLVSLTRDVEYREERRGLTAVVRLGSQKTSSHGISE